MSFGSASLRSATNLYSILGPKRIGGFAFWGRKFLITEFIRKIPIRSGKDADFFVDLDTNGDICYI